MGKNGVIVVTFFPNWFCSNGRRKGVHAGSVLYGRLGNLRYIGVRQRTSASCCDYSMGFCGDGVLFGIDVDSTLFYSSPDLNPVIGPAWMHCIVQG